MRRRSGNSLAWQSVLTEQDQTRFLRFRNVVEVWEFDVGFDKDFGRFTTTSTTSSSTDRWKLLRRRLEVIGGRE